MESIRPTCPKSGLPSSCSAMESQSTRGRVQLTTIPSNSVSSLCFSVFCRCTAAQCCWRFKFVESGLTAQCPFQLKTGHVLTSPPIVRTPLLTSSLIIVPSRMFRMCGFFSSVFPGWTIFCIEMRSLATFALLNVMHHNFLSVSNCDRSARLAVTFE